ncbi:MAG: hypothetical protein ACXWW7_08030 [Nocardioides sp.]
MQIHGMDGDPFFTEEGADLDAAGPYPGDQHLFTDASLLSYDAAAAELLVQRVLDFLSSR